MAKRKVEVELILDAHNFLDETAKAAVATKALEAETEHLDSAVNRTGTDLSDMAKNTDRAKDSVTGFGRTTHDTGEALRLLDARIAQTKLSVRDLGVEFATTGDAATGKELGSARSLLGTLTSLRKEVAAAHEEMKKLDSLNINSGKTGIRKWIDDIQSAVGDATAAGVKIGGAIVSAIGGTLGSLGPLAMPILISSLVGAAVVAAPMLGAIIGGAVAGGVGTLGVAAGIFAATHDPLVQSGLAALGTQVKTEFFAAGAAFVEPVMASLDVLKHALADIKFGETLKLAAPYVEIIVTGLADLLRNIMPGLNATMARLGPFARVAQQGFADLGTALGGFLDDVTRSPGTIEGLKTAFVIINGTVNSLGKTIYGLSEAFDWMLRTTYAAAVAFGNLAAHIPGLQGFGEVANTWARITSGLGNIPDAADGASHSFDRFADSGTKAAAKLDPFARYLWEAKHGVDGLHTAMSTLFADEMGMDQATLRWQEDILKLTEATQKHGHTLDTNTQAGLDNRRMILGLIQDADGIRQATVKQTGSIEEGNRAYEREIVLLEEKLKKLGYTKTQIDEMVGDYEINVDINLNYKTSGSFPQQAKNLALEDRLTKSYKKPAPKGKRAAGGPVGPGAWLVGDGGRPEILQMGAGQYGHVYPSVQSWQSMQSPAGGWQGGGGGGGGDINVVVSAAPGADSQLLSGVMQYLRFTVDTQFAGNSQAALSRRRR